MFYSKNPVHNFSGRVDNGLTYFCYAEFCKLFTDYLSRNNYIFVVKAGTYLERSGGFCCHCESLTNVFDIPVE